jgi:hypothetical protein
MQNCRVVRVSRADETKPLGEAIASDDTRMQLALTATRGLLFHSLSTGRMRVCAFTKIPMDRNVHIWNK